MFSSEYDCCSCSVLYNLIYLHLALPCLALPLPKYSDKCTTFAHQTDHCTTLYMLIYICCLVQLYDQRWHLLPGPHGQGVPQALSLPLSGGGLPRLRGGPSRRTRRRVSACGYWDYTGCAVLCCAILCFAMMYRTVLWCGVVCYDIACAVVPLRCGRLEMKYRYMSCDTPRYTANIFLAALLNSALTSPPGGCALWRLWVDSTPSSSSIASFKRDAETTWILIRVRI